METTHVRLRGASADKPLSGEVVVRQVIDGASRIDTYRRDADGKQYVTSAINPPPSNPNLP